MSLVFISGSYEINGHLHERRETPQARRNETNAHKATPVPHHQPRPADVLFGRLQGLIYGPDELSRTTITSGALIERIADQSG